MAAQISRRSGIAVKSFDQNISVVARSPPASGLGSTVEIHRGDGRKEAISNACAGHLIR